MKTFFRVTYLLVYGSRSPAARICTNADNTCAFVSRSSLRTYKHCNLRCDQRFQLRKTIRVSNNSTKREQHCQVELKSEQGVSWHILLVVKESILVTILDPRSLSAEPVGDMVRVIHSPQIVTVSGSQICKI